MPTATRSLAAIGLAALLFAATPGADDPPPPLSPHIRALSPDLQSLLDEAAARSAAFRGLVARIDASNLIVYLDFRLFSQMEVEGRLVFVGASAGTRYALVHLACPRTRMAQLAALGHELGHAAVAAAPSVVDAKSMAEHYLTIGLIAREWPRGVGYETRAAAAVGSKVQDEVEASIRADAAAQRAARGSALHARN